MKKTTGKWIVGVSVLAATIVIVYIVTAKSKENAVDHIVDTDIFETDISHTEESDLTTSGFTQSLVAMTTESGQSLVTTTTESEQSLVATTTESAQSLISTTYSSNNEINNENETYENSMESTSTKKYEIVELHKLSTELFSMFRHQTTNTVWNGETTAKVMHPEQLEYLNNIAEKWYKGNISASQVKDMALNSAPIKTNEDMLQLTGFYQEFVGDEALFKVVDVDVAKLKFDGRRAEISEDELWQSLCDAGEDSATANYLYVKACYDEKEAATFVYYFDCRFQWINNNFQW